MYSSSPRRERASAAASITFVFGFALLYAAVGVLDYPGIGTALATGCSQPVDDDRIGERATLADGGA